MIINTTNYDVIIAGAGVSGLLLAYSMSQHCRILVLDSSEDIQQNKFWVTSGSCLTENAELLPAVDKRFGRMWFSDAYGNDHVIKGDYILWDTQKLLRLLLDKIEHNGGSVLFSHRFCGYNYHQHGITIFANEKSFNARLFIDCMGFASPLVLSKEILKLHGYYYLYGAKIKLREPIEPICLSNVMLDNRPKYFEVFPDSSGYANAVIIYPTKTIEGKMQVEKDFNYLVSHSKYAKHFDFNNNLNKPLGGIVPVGTMRRKALDNIYFFGESAQSNPAATGTCLSRLLLNHNKVSAFLLEKLSSNKLSEKELSMAPNTIDRFTQKLQLYAYQELLNSNSDRFSKFIGYTPNVSDELLNKFIFGDLTSADFLDKKRLLKLLRKENWSFIKPIFNAFT